MKKIKLLTLFLFLGLLFSCGSAQKKKETPPEKSKSRIERKKTKEPTLEDLGGYLYRPPRKIERTLL